jgi:DNA-binding transcriptional MerR regulator
VTPKLYKAADVCEMTGLQPYVLRSWEKEFPGIGVQKSPESPRLYRQSDVDQVVRIKQLVFSEGLTLAGARRRLDTAPAAPAAAPEIEESEALEVLGADARSRIAAVRSGLRAILDALSKAPGVADIAALPERSANGNGAARSDRGSAERGGRSGPPTHKVAVAAKRSAPSKRAASSRKPARAAKRKRANA